MELLLELECCIFTAPPQKNKLQLSGRPFKRTMLNLFFAMSD